MDLSLRGTLILAALVLPYAGEVFYQVWLQARFVSVVPPAVRASWPRRPRRPWLSFYASLRFQFAVLRYARLKLSEDTPEVAFWKKKMRASMVRESCLLASLTITAIVLALSGWRPVWP